MQSFAGFLRKNEKIISAGGGRGVLIERGFGKFLEKK